MLYLRQHARLAVLAFICSAGMVFGLWSLPIGKYLEQSIGWRFLFAARSAAGLEPTVDPRIKLLVMEDDSLEKVQRYDLNLREWSDVILTLNTAKPSAILIDKLFGYPDGIGSANKFVDALRDKVPLYAGVFHTSAPRGGRADLADRFVEPVIAGLESSTGLGGAEPQFLYGPPRSIQDAFRGLGHLTYGHMGAVVPIVRLRNGGLVPHMALYTASSVEHDGKSWVVGGTRVGADSGEPVLANLVPTERFLAGAWPLSSLLTESGVRKVVGDIREGDVVLILPAMFTGNTDFKDTAIGRIPGGIIIASMINSVLTGKWLRFFPEPLLLIGGLLILGFGAGVFLPLALFWPVLAGLLATLIVSTFFAFTELGTVVPWFHATLALTLPSIFLYERRSAQKKRENTQLRDALEGVIPVDKVERLIKLQKPFRREASEQVMTVMFIDIVGFSRAAEQLTPRAVFDGLREYFDTLIELIHQNGGAVDKLLGDGILCYFGYRFEDDSPEHNHPDAALACAIAIQEASVKRCIRAHERGEPVFPVRIGLNTASVFFGDLGGARRVEFTCIGSGVNLAHRLESACDPFRIMVGFPTVDLVKNIPRNSPCLTRKIVQIKHQLEPVEAYEFDVFHENPGQYLKAFQAYRDYSNLQRLENRWPIQDIERIGAHTNYGEGRIVDFSRSGLGVVLPAYLGKGVDLTIDLFSEAAELQGQIEKLGKLPIVGEVRWSRRHNGQFLHGILIKNLHEDQRQMLIETLREVLVFEQKRLRAG